MEHDTLKINQSYSAFSQGPMPGHRTLRMGLPRPNWVRLNRLRTGVERFQSSLHKMELAPTSICECGTLHQTAFHLMLECSLYRAPIRYHGLLVLDDETGWWPGFISVLL